MGMHSGQVPPSTSSIIFFSSFIRGDGRDSSHFWSGDDFHSALTTRKSCAADAGLAGNAYDVAACEQVGRAVDHSVRLRQPHSACISPLDKPRLKDRLTLAKISEP